MARTRVVMDKLEQELDAMHSAENGGVADNEAIEQDISTMLSEMNHMGAIDPFENEEDEQQQPEIARVHTQEQRQTHMRVHELDGAVGERHDNSTSYQQQQEKVIKPPIFSNTKGRKSKTQAAAKKPTCPIKRVEFGPDGKPLGVRACGFCNVVSNHNYRTCPLRTDATVNKNKHIGATQLSTNGDNTREKWMLEKSGLEINPNNLIDMQRNWKDPKTDKYYDSLADVAGGVIHPFYEGMKKKMNREDHKLWGNSPLPDNLIMYAGIDAYATYKSWKTIDNIVTGWDISKE
ncbi:hypothetical protein VPH35_111792 [Triticum aestivum]|uniref:Uncharacterized protein n=1 Tax=Triticum turgidum subsp. durum TaxID=4567 RepID=A0A9R0YQL7_TRITD|nr:unnamed protein product [Triticum turgidum subsp. durum]